jgi:hypothetical protein
MRILQDENVVHRVVGFVCHLPTDAAAQAAVQ